MLVTLKIIIDDRPIGDIVTTPAQAYGLINAFTEAIHRPDYCGPGHVQITVIANG